jgi:hypothetical protein
MWVCVRGGGVVICHMSYVIAGAGSSFIGLRALSTPYSHTFPPPPYPPPHCPPASSRLPLPLPLPLPQDIEFTVQDGVLYLLQTRSGKRSARASVCVAASMVRERMITEREALLRIDPNHMDFFLHPTIDLAAGKLPHPVIEMRIAMDNPICLSACLLLSLSLPLSLCPQLLRTTQASSRASLARVWACLQAQRLGTWSSAAKRPRRAWLGASPASSCAWTQAKTTCPGLR